MDVEEKIIERYEASANARATVPNNADYLRRLLISLYACGGGDGLYRWSIEDREFFLDTLLDAGEGRDFKPFPLPWPPSSGQVGIPDIPKDIAERMAVQLIAIHRELSAYGKLGIARKIRDAAIMIDGSVEENFNVV